MDAAVVQARLVALGHIHTAWTAPTFSGAHTDRWSERAVTVGPFRLMGCVAH
jgi:hypothetical protein